MSQMKVNNPIIWSDFPDPDVIRVEDTYYMISTTMHTMPGGVLLRSYDLIHWEIASYVYERLDSTKEQRLEDRKGIYGKGMWAATLRYHKGTFYVIFVCNDTQKTYLYTSQDIEGPWKKQNIEGFYHDCSLLFDDDDRAYLVSGNRSIRLMELKEDLSGPKEGGLDKIILVDSDDYGLGFEGSHLYKINGYYYLFLIHWKKTGSQRRVEACYRAETLDGEWIGGDVLDDDLEFHNMGVAQGGIVDTPDGEWYGMLFQDHGAVGRIPCIVPMHWEDDMPVFGMDGKVPAYVEIKSTRPEYQYEPLVISDEFEYEPEEAGKIRLHPAWQWNHEPDDSCWSLTERKGFLRLKTDDLRVNAVQAKNSLTQRTMGSSCDAVIKLDGSGMKDGDYAGLTVLQGNYGFVGLLKENGRFYVVMLGRSVQAVDAQGRPEAFDQLPGIEYGRVEVQNPVIRLKAACNFADSIDEADFFYDRNGQWESIGTTVHMRFTLDHFMGYRYALTYFSTKEAGGMADFDSYKIHVAER